MKSGNIIFDLDGTLYDTEKVSVEALQTALSRFDIQGISDEEIKGQFGEVTDVIVRNLVPDRSEDFYDDLKEEIKYQEEKLIPVKGRLYDGIKEVLEELDREGYNMSICSNGREKYIKMVLDTTEIMKFFKKIRGNEPGKSKAFQLRDIVDGSDLENSVMVGDRYHDIEAARKVGIPSIGAAYGFGKEEVRSADYIAMKPSDILKIVSDI